MGLSMKCDQRIIAVRLPTKTYNKLIKDSYDEKISASSYIRTILIGYLNDDDIDSEETELDKIRCYKAKKEKELV